MHLFYLIITNAMNNASLRCVRAVRPFVFSLKLGDTPFELHFATTRHSHQQPSKVFKAISPIDLRTEHVCIHSRSTIHRYHELLRHRRERRYSTTVTSLQYVVVYLSSTSICSLSSIYYFIVRHVVIFMLLRLICSRQDNLLQGNRRRVQHAKGSIRNRRTGMRCLPRRPIHPTRPGRESSGRLCRKLIRKRGIRR